MFNRGGCLVVFVCFFICLVEVHDLNLAQITGLLNSYPILIVITCWSRSRFKTMELRVTFSAMSRIKVQKTVEEKEVETTDF